MARTKRAISSNVDPKTSENEKTEVSPILRESLSYNRDHGFEHEYSLARMAKMTNKLKLIHPIELTSELLSFH